MFDVHRCFNGSFYLCFADGSKLDDKGIDR